MIRKAVSVALLVILVIGIAIALASRFLIDPEWPGNTVFLFHAMPAIFMLLVSLGLFAAILGLTMLMERVLGSTSPEESLYIWAGAIMLCFILSFYSRYLGYASYFFRGPYTVVQILALAALVQAYRRIGGVGYLLWLAPVVVELLFWPRVLLQVVFVRSFWYPFWYETAYLYLIIFLAGLYLTRRRYLQLEGLSKGGV